MIDVGVTATLRPEILERTLTSFIDNLFSSMDSDDFGFIINIDPVGHEIYPPDMLYNITEILKDYRVVFILPDNASFPKAFCRVWQIALEETIRSPYFFNLEDDWELTRPVNLSGMVDVMDSDESLASLRLPMFPSGNGSMKNWNLFFPWAGAYYQCPEEYKVTAGFCGHPSLIRKKFMLRTFPYMKDDRNPEKQFHQKGGVFHREALKWEYGVIGSAGDPPYIKDIGRQWMIENSFAKEGNKAFFTQWIKQPSKNT